MEQNEWYDNKELYEMLQALKDDIAELRKDMSETRAVIRDYNNLRHRIEETSARLNTLMWLVPIALTAIGILAALLK